MLHLCFSSFHVLTFVDVCYLFSLMRSKVKTRHRLGTLLQIEVEIMIDVELYEKLKKNDARL